MVKQQYSNENFIITIEEDEQAYFYAMKDGDELYCALIIKVYRNLGNKRKGQYLGCYYNIWEQETNSNTINVFIKNILEKPDFRKDYLSEGEGFEEVISYTNESGVNKKCQEAIDNLYAKKYSKRTFKDYMNLKTFGIDKYSRMKLDKIKELLNTKDIELVKSAFDDEKAILSALRWCCRGLLVDDAIRKVKTDLEIANNMK